MGYMKGRLTGRPRLPICQITRKMAILSFPNRARRGRRPYPANTLLQFDDTGQLQFAVRPLPDGRYALGLYAADQNGANTEAFTEVNVADNRLVDGRIYRDPNLRFQFIVPPRWLPPLTEVSGVAINSTQVDGQIRLTILPDLPRQSTAVSLQQQALTQFGEVDILHEGERLVGGMKALETAYGYTDESGREHSGIFYTFISCGYENRKG